MKLWSTDEDGVRRVLGIPVGIPFDTDSEVTLRAFEPENPKLWVPRTVGAGWDLNLGAVAVKLGLLRPDDSIPDLQQHFPEGVKQFLRWSPWIGAAVSAASALMVKDLPRAASNWSLGARPLHYMRGSALAGMTAGIAIGTPLLLGVISRTDLRTDADKASCGSRAGSIDAAAAAQSVGLQTLVALANLAAYREANNPGTRQPLLLLGLLSAPVITGGILVGAVRAALRNIDHDLRAH